MVFTRNLLILKRYVFGWMVLVSEVLFGENNSINKEKLLICFLISRQLPDYHEVIDNPMDFTTVRNKLQTGSYATLEQLEVNLFNLSSSFCLFLCVEQGKRHQFSVLGCVFWNSSSSEQRHWHSKVADLASIPVLKLYFLLFLSCYVFGL